MEWKSELISVNKDNSHSWVRISHGLNKLVPDLIDKKHDDDEQETSEMQSEEFALKTNALAFASRSKAKAKPRRRTSASSSSRTVPICERSWTVVESGTYSHIASPVSKRLSTLLRHGHPTSRRRWCDWIPEIKRLSSVRIWELSTLVWRNVEEQNARKRRPQEKISILYWLVRTRNSVSSSSPKSFKTQSHWSFCTGQCIDSEKFLRVHVSYWMCGQFTLHHKFRINTGRTKFGQGKTDGILYSRESYEQGTQRSVWYWLCCTTSCMVKAENVETTPRHGVLGRYTTCSTEKDLGSIKQDRRQSSFTTLIVSRKLLWWTLEKSCTKKYLCHLGLLQRFPWNMIGWKNWIQKLLEAWATSRFVQSGDRKRCRVWSRRHKLKNGETCGWTTIQPELCASVCWTCRQRQRQRRRRRRRSNKNGETRVWTTNRFVHSARGNRHWLQSTKIVTCNCETSRKIPRSRAVKKIESHHHREAFRADLQQKNVYKPFSNNSKALIREMGNVELFELCETAHKVQCSQCLFYWIKELRAAPSDSSWLKANPEESLTN